MSESDGTTRTSRTGNEGAARPATANGAASGGADSPTVADQRGVVDLAALNSAPAAGGPGGAGSAQPAPPMATEPPAGTPTVTINAPLESDVSEANLQEIMALSATVPVMMLIYSPSSLASKQTLEVLQDAVRAAKGAVHLAKVNAEAAPALVQALQVQTIPMGVAIIANRPVPVFEGPANAQQVEALLQQILQLAPQIGVTGRLAVSDANLEKPTPPEHEPALAAEAAGDWEGAINAWRKVLANSPRDGAAEKGIARAELMLRRENEQREAADAAGDPLAQADALFAEGSEAQAFELLLAQLAAGDAKERERVRTRLVDMFKIATDTPAVKAARQRLATLLMV